jgi:MoaA/NifB/PqqE/SkfB family radical SAM enzyme
MRACALDGKLLLFDRDSGMRTLCEGDETRHLRQQAPLSVQFAITNRCNLACGFCSRDVAAPSRWTLDSALTLLAGLAQAGVLEVAFGGGEPWAFPHFSELVSRLHEETPLAVHATTNGMLLSRERLRSVRGRIGELRLSLYDDNDWRATVALFVEEGVRFGVNWLLTPERLPDLETTVLDLTSRGCRDVLLLRYKGPDPALHLDPSQMRELERRLAVLQRALTARCQLKLDVCWGERLERLPRLFAHADCGAGRDFIVLTSDGRLMPCSFHQTAFPIETAEDVLRIWRAQRDALLAPSTWVGCARSEGP